MQGNLSCNGIVLQIVGKYSGFIKTSNRQARGKGIWAGQLTWIRSFMENVGQDDNTS